MFKCCPFTTISIFFFFPPTNEYITKIKLVKKEMFYHRQTSSSSSFFFRLPVVSLTGDELIVGFVSFFGVTFSCLIFVAGFLTGDDDGFISEVFSFFTTTGVVEFDFFSA
jgi:hypothetical protein